MNKHDAEQLISQLEGSYFSSDEKEEMKSFYLSSFVTDEMALKSNQWTRICEFGCPVMVWQEGLLTEEQAKETSVISPTVKFFVEFARELSDGDK